MLENAKQRRKRREVHKYFEEENFMLVFVKLTEIFNQLIFQSQFTRFGKSGKSSNGQ